MESPTSGITFSRWLQSSSLAQTAASSTDPRRVGDHVTHSSVESAWASQTLFSAKSSQREMPFSSLMLSVFRHRDKVFMLQALFLSKIWLRWTKAVGAPFKTCLCGPFQLLWHPHIQSGPIHRSPGWFSPFPIRIFRWLLALGRDVWGFLSLESLLLHWLDPKHLIPTNHTDDLWQRRFVKTSVTTNQDFTQEPLKAASSPEY